MRSNMELWYDRFVPAQVWATRDELVAFQIQIYGTPQPADQLKEFLCFYKKRRACELMRAGQQPYAILPQRPAWGDPDFPRNAR